MATKIVMLNPGQLGTGLPPKGSCDAVMPKGGFERSKPPAAKPRSVSESGRKAVSCWGVALRLAGGQ